MTALLAAHVSTSVLRVQLQRVRSIQSTQTFASIAELAQAFVLQRLSKRVVNVKDTGLVRGAFEAPLFYETPPSTAAKNKGNEAIVTPSTEKHSTDRHWSGVLLHLYTVYSIRSMF